VRGTVVDSGNQPLAGASVFGISESNARREIRAMTNSYGQFSLSHVPVGTLYVDAYKESAGHPYSFFSFFKVDDRPVKVSVVEGVLTNDVVIRLGAKAARLHLEITDANDSRPAGGINLVFSRDDMPGEYRTSARANESLLVPAIPFRFSVEVPGFKPWHYGGDAWKDNSGLVVLKPDESKTIVIRLAPL
jgi:hypothetical protein